MSSSPPILNIERLSIAYRQHGVWLDAVRDVSLRIERGQVYGLVGESGSGKSTLALAIMRYLDENGRVQSGSIKFDGIDLLAQSAEDMRSIWGARIGLVPQDPLSSLNPSIRVGEQIAEALRLHKNLSQREAAARALELLAMVRVPDPARIAASYAHQTSGGMQQRAMIAMALGVEPQLLVLDEPTTGLDVTTAAAVLDLIGDLIREHHTSALYVTHNLGVVARICDRVGVLYAGDLVEVASTVDLYAQPLHPYTAGLLDSVPRIGQNKIDAQLQAIGGRIPTLGARPSACVFAPRCPLVIDICHIERPPLDEAGADRLVRCHRWREIQSGAIDPRPAPSEIAQASVASIDREAVLTVTDLEARFPVRRSIAEVLAGEAQRSVRAVDGVDLQLARGRTLGLVGESGSGKTTLARAIVGLVESSRGRIELLGIRLPLNLSQRDIETLRHVQIVFQNPEEALNPYLTIGETLSRPLITLLGKSREEAQAEVERLLSAVQLSPDYAQRLPGQLSGGEKQRVAIARAFAATPDLLIFDEPVSALDVSVQASILNLLGRLQAERHNASLFISHDLAVVGYLADDIAVIYAGQLMEVAQANDLFKPPYHPYTEALLSAIPLPNPKVQQEQIRLEGDVPSQLEDIKGCPFHTRCPRFLGDICVNQKPPWQIADNGARIYCHIPLDELRLLQKDVLVVNTT